MARELLSAVEKFSETCGGFLLEGQCIDDILEQRIPKSQGKTSHAALKKELEDRFLSPPSSLGPKWLNKVQQ